MSDDVWPPIVDWIYEDKLGAMPLPSVGELEQLRDSGVGLVITLTQEWYNPAVFRAAGLRSVHIPVADMHAPDLEQIREFVAEVDAAIARGEKVVAHCLGGLGRTGTMIACYLVSRGLSADEALDMVRRKRRGSVESGEQERVVWQWWREIKKA